MLDFFKQALEELGKVLANGCMFYGQRDILAKNNLYIYDSSFIQYVQFKNIDSEEIIPLAIEYYSKNKFKNLNSLVMRWSSLSLFEDRKNILETISNTLSSNLPDKDKCNLLVPLLLSLLDYLAKKQIDNIFDYEKPKGFPSLKNVLKSLKEEIPNGHSYMETYFSIIDYIHYSKNEDEEQENGFYIVPESVKKYNLSRNAIIHGDEVNYGTIENLIRLINMIDFIYLTEEAYIKTNTVPLHTLSVMSN